MKPALGGLTQIQTLPVDDNAKTWNRFEERADPWTSMYTTMHRRKATMTTRAAQLDPSRLVVSEYRVESSLLYSMQEVIDSKGGST